MNGRTAGLVLVALVAVLGLAGLGTWRLVSAVGPDVNNDGKVRSKDITAVVQAYGQNVPNKLDVWEQNVDGGGSIRVHEQGIADVHVTNPKLSVNGTVNVSNLPLDGEGNVKVASQISRGSTYTLLNNVTIGARESIVTDFVDVAGCRDFEVFLRNAGDVNTQGTDWVTSGLELSSDGAVAYAKLQGVGFGNDIPFQIVDGSSVNTVTEWLSFEQGSGFRDIFAPFARVRFTGGAVSRSISAALFCLP